jgi:hypothetical protein
MKVPLIVIADKIHHTGKPFQIFAWVCSENKGTRIRTISGIINLN